MSVAVGVTLDVYDIVGVSDDVYETVGDLLAVKKKKKNKVLVGVSLAVLDNVGV